MIFRPGSVERERAHRPGQYRTSRRGLGVLDYSASHAFVVIIDSGERLWERK